MICKYVNIWDHTHTNQIAYQKFILALKVFHLICLYFLDNDNFVSYFPIFILNFSLFKTMARNPYNNVKCF